MPYESLRQERWAHTKDGTKALGGPDKVKEWDMASKGMKLPKRSPTMKLKKASTSAPHMLRGYPSPFQRAFARVHGLDRNAPSRMIKRIVPR